MMGTAVVQPWVATESWMYDGSDSPESSIEFVVRMDAFEIRVPRSAEVLD